MARIKSTWTHLLLVSAISILYCSLFTSARNLDSKELSIGVWNVTMKCRRSSFTSDVFPPRVAREPQQIDVDQTRNTRRRRQWLPSWGGDSSQSFDCQLNLFSDGTFAMKPRDEKSWTRLAGTSTNILGSINQGGSEPVTTESNQTPPYLVVHGRWKVHSNPYCVTDRSYDEVSLTSVPRVQTRITPTNVEQSAGEMDHATQQIQQRRLRLLMQCRLSGHCTNGGLARLLVGDSYARGRISRGVILSQDELAQQDSNSKSKPWWQSHNKVVASFSARRQIPPGFSLEEDDLLDDNEYEP
jgi:hypothetical protein